eukprot:446462_1
MEPISAGCFGLVHLFNCTIETTNLNATIQCLFHCPMLVEYILNNEHSNSVESTAQIIDEFATLLRKYWSEGHKALSLKTLESLISKKLKAQDIQNFESILSFLLNELCQYSDKNNLFIRDLITTEIISQKTCSDCNNESITANGLTSVCVPIPTITTIITSTNTVTVIAPKRESIHRYRTLLLISNHIHTNIDKIAPVEIQHLIFSFIPNDILPTKYIMQSPTSYTISYLKNKLSILTEIPKNQLILCDIWNHQIYNTFPDFKLIETLNDNDSLMCYNVPLDEQLKINKFKTAIKFEIVPIYHQKKSVPTDLSTISSSRYHSYESIGTPFVIKLPLLYDININELIDDIKVLLEPFCQNINVSDSYELVILDKYGQSCGECVYSSICDGCNLTKLQNNILAIPDSTYDKRSIGIRWHSDAVDSFDHDKFTTATNGQNACYLEVTECVRQFFEIHIFNHNCDICTSPSDVCTPVKNTLYKLPKILIVELERSYDNNEYIKYEINGLDLKQWMDIDNVSDETEFTYDLFGMTVKSDKGYLVAFCKHLKNKKWYKFDNEIVTQINEKNIGMNICHKLFYVKRNQ